MDYIDTVFHPIIEDFICRYAEGDLDETELSAFRDVMSQHVDLKTLAETAKAGKQCIEEMLSFLAI